MRTHLLLLALCVALVASGGGRAGGSPRFGPIFDCETGLGFTCRNLAVPLDHSRRRPGTLQLRVALATDLHQPRGALVILTGGPGQPGVRNAAWGAMPFIWPLMHDYRLVLVDQRGTGPNALRCPALQAAMGGSDLAPPPASAVRACAAAIGTKRQFYGTDDVVADLELLRQALGADKLSLDGISYGTYVAERYALAHPSRVQKLVLDSVVPHEPVSALGTVGMRASARVLRDVCRQTPCTSDPASDLAAVVRKRHDGPRLLDALTLLSIIDPSYRVAIDVPTVLQEARAGRLAGLNDLFAWARRWNAAPAEYLSQGLHASTLCADWRYPWGDSSTPLTGRAAALARAVKRLPERAVWPFDRGTASGNGFVRQCLPWSPTAPTPLPPKGAKLTVPTLLVNGDRDLSTPLEWARQEAALAPNGRLVVVAGAGHSVQSRAKSDAGREAVYAFLRSP
jgi:pimeloyl-ACP methyl ester carboxylesterase